MVLAVWCERCGASGVVQRGYQSKEEIINMKGGGHFSPPTQSMT